MKISFDFDKLERLLKSFYLITNMRYSLIGQDHRVMFAFGSSTSFCELIHRHPEGLQRCVACDRKAACHMDSQKGLHVYRCHAGATEMAIPITERGEVIAYLFFGQVLPQEESIDAQWQYAKEQLCWYEDLSELKEAFYQLPRISADSRNACGEIVSACTSYIRLEGIVKGELLTDYQRLYTYIEQKYGEPLSLEDASQALRMSKTKICNLAAQHGSTFCTMLQSRRIEEAKRMLTATDCTIAEISGKVGIPDYNYFSKLFRKHTGMSPRMYREANT